ncbi:MAG: NAD-dependent epimerase/dehydratase family protein [Acidobacteriaceae bacterium]
MRKVLITGIAGFIGSALAHQCSSLGCDVRGIDNLSAGDIENIADIEEIEFYRGSLTNRRLLRHLCEGVDTIFHHAALPSVAGSIEDPVASHVANLDGTLNLLLEARRQGVRRVIYASSSAAYGDSDFLPKAETMLPAPISPYAIQKLAGEYYMRCFARLYGIETVSLRYFNVFGPRQSADSPYSGVLARFINAMLSDQNPEIYGNGTQSRDFVYIDDVVEANLLAASADAAVVSGEVFNIARGERHTLLETYEILADILHFRGLPKFLEARPGDIRHSQADIRQAREHLGYAPRVSFRNGLERTAAWYQEARGRPALVALAGD